MLNETPIPIREWQCESRWIVSKWPNELLMNYLLITSFC
jgi:hypothetical protein